MASRRGFVVGYLLAPLAANLVFVGWLAARDPSWWGFKGLWERLECLAGRQAPLVQGLHQELSRSDPLVQRLLAAEPGEPRAEPAEAQGWKVYTVPEGQAGQTLVFEVRPAGRELSFHPRASGAESSVEVSLESGGKSRSVARLQGPPGAWTPIGARWSVSLACHDPGAPLTVRVRLTGPWAQLWARDGAPFF